MSSDPLDPSKVKELRGNIIAHLTAQGRETRSCEKDKTQSTPRWRIFGAVEGVPLRVGVRMPRLPAIYSRKKRWRIEAQATAQEDPGWQEGVLVELSNCCSATTLLPALKRVLQADVEAGLVEKTSKADATLRCGSKLRIAALGAQVKGVDALIKGRDQDQTSPPDVKGAHRLIPVRQEDWGLQACALEGGDSENLNRVGTFGLLSASYWWSRAGGAMARPAHYVVGKRAHTWMLLVADDLMQSAAGPERQPALFVLMVLASVLDVPISWHKSGRSGTNFSRSTERAYQRTEPRGQSVGAANSSVLKRMRSRRWKRTWGVYLSSQACSVRSELSSRLCIAFLLSRIRALNGPCHHM